MSSRRAKPPYVALRHLSRQEADRRIEAGELQQRVVPRPVHRPLLQRFADDLPHAPRGEPLFARDVGGG